MQDEMIVAAVLAGARLAREQDPTPERAADLLGEALREVERSRPGRQGPDDPEVDPTRLAAR